jgi:LysM repeat protein
MPTGDMATTSGAAVAARARPGPAIRRTGTALARLARSRRARGLAVPVLLAAAVTASAGTAITVHWGDTLSGIAARHHTSVAELVALNHLAGSGDVIYAGQRLRLPGGSAAPASSSYTVRPGDTLSALGARFGVSPGSIARSSGLSGRGHIEVGQILHVPGGTKAAPSVPVPAVPRGTVRDTIVRTAQRFGVDPALALAVAWQESGFNQAMVSPSGAIGAMQVMPSTGKFVSRWIAGHPLDLHNARDNITAGVAVLASLRHQTSTTSEALAGYYQGLASVRSHGMYRDTKHYVANVLALRERFSG